MIRLTTLLGLFAHFTLQLSAQTDYKTGTKYKDGYVSISYSIPAKGSSYYGSTTEFRFGLMEQKTGKIVLPMIYKSLFSSNEPDIYVIKDTLDKFALINVKTGSYILKHEYYRIDAFSEGLALVQKKGTGYDYLYGAVDKTGKIILPLTYEYLGTHKDGLLNFKQDNRYGFIDQTGKMVIPNVYSIATTFGNGLAPALLPDTMKYGYINKQNKMVIPAIYADAYPFVDGYARVYKSKGISVNKTGTSVTTDDEIGIIDVNGKEIIEPRYAYISSKGEGGTFQVRLKGKYGLFDSTGKMLQPCKYSDMRFFNEGYTVVQDSTKKFGMLNAKGVEVLPVVYSEISTFKEGLAVLRKDRNISIMDKNLKTIVPGDTALKGIVGKDRLMMVFQNAVKLYDLNGKLVKTIKQDNIESFNTIFTANEDSIQIGFKRSIWLYNTVSKTYKALDLEEVSDFNEEGIFLGKKGNYNYYDYTFKKLNTKSYASAHNFSEGIAAVQESSYSYPYLIDKNFNTAGTLSTVFYGPYSEGLAKAKSQYGNTWYYLDKKGLSVFSVYALEAGNCKNGRIMIKDGETSFYYVNKSGKKINSETYQGLGDFSQGLARYKKNNKLGFIDTSGNAVIPAQFVEASDFSNGAAIAKTGTDYFLINATGAAINNDKYSSAKSPANGTFPVQKGLGFGLIDAKGKTVVDFKYQEILPMYEDLAWAKKDGKWGLVNSKGKEITAFQYEGANNFDNGYASVLKEGKYGLLDKTGKLILSPEYSSISKVHNDAVIIMKEKGTIRHAVK
jgi:hypothetical protein